jgi:hypothetical protein
VVYLQADMQVADLQADLQADAQVADMQVADLQADLRICHLIGLIEGKDLWNNMPYGIIGLMK